MFPHKTRVSRVPQLSCQSWRQVSPRHIKHPTRSFRTDHNKHLIPDSKFFQVSEEVREAVANNRPVVALETTIYTHGFPYPDNIALASKLESEVRINGGIPATIGVFNGIAKVGLSPSEIIELASAAGKSDTMKVSRRDLPFITGLGIAGKKLHGGTTVAGTMILSHLAGIEVFGTGGLGGVHRGGEVTMDVSADLTELGRTAVAVISSGCKSFLDIPRTLEYLETQGVGVSTFADGRTGNVDFPAFWTRESGVSSPTVVHDEKEAAAIIFARRSLNIESGLLFANPIPTEYSIPKSEMDGAIEAAVREASEKGFHGHANTPFILAKIKELTGGKSIPANRALIESNVIRATKVAVELSRLGGSNHLFTPVMQYVHGQKFQGSTGAFSPTSPPSPSPTKADILVAGSVAIDLSCDYAPFDGTTDLSPILYTSNPAIIRQSVGGVGHNVADAAHLICSGSSTSVRLCSLVADDLAGSLILSSLQQRGLDTSGITKLGSDAQTRTAQYIAVNKSNKDLEVAMADMDILRSSARDFSELWQPQIKSAAPKWFVVDGNWNTETVGRFALAAKEVESKVAFEPVSVQKSAGLFPAMKKQQRELSVYPNHVVDLATPNQHELASMHSAAQLNGYFQQSNWWELIDSLGIPSSGARSRFVSITGNKLVDDGIPQMMVQLLPFIPTVITKLGAEGVLLTMLLKRDDKRLSSPASAPYIVSRSTTDAASIGGVYMRLFPAAEVVEDEDVVSVNGVGDTFLGVLIAGLTKGVELDEKLINLAQHAAVLTLKSTESVSPDIKHLAARLDALIGTS